MKLSEDAWSLSRSWNSRSRNSAWKCRRGDHAEHDLSQLAACYEDGVPDTTQLGRAGKEVAYLRLICSLLELLQLIGA